MIDLAKIQLPDAVSVSGSLFRIHTGHPYWFRFEQLLNDKETRYGDFDFLYIEEKPADRSAGFYALFDFYYCKPILPRTEDDPRAVRVRDFTIDAEYIYAAILQCFNVDLFEKEIHWHKVRAMLNAVTGTRLNDIMSFRTSTDIKNTEMKRLKTAWALPETDAEQIDEGLREFNALFN